MHKQLVGSMLLTLSALTAAAADQVAVSTPPVIAGRANSVAIDSAGNVYVAGDFLGTHDFNPGVGEYSQTSGGGGVMVDAYCTRFNADGTHAWTQTFGGSADDVATNVKVSNGVVYVLGGFASSDAGFGGSGTVAALANDDGFVLALDAASGAPVTGFDSDGIQVLAGNGQENTVGLAISGTTLFISGDFLSSNLGIGGAGIITSGGSVNVFVAALDAVSGGALAGFGSNGIQTFGGSSQDSAQNIAVDNGRIFVAGFFGSLNAGIGGSGTTAAAGTDAFIFSLNANDGTAITSFGTNGVQTFGGSGFDTGVGVISANNTVYLSGNFTSADAGIGGLGAIAPTGAMDGYVIALSALTGAPSTLFGTNGVQKLAGASSENAERMALNNGVLYLSGILYSANFGIGAAGTVPSAGSGDAFIVALDAITGAAVTSFSSDGIETFGGTLGDYGYDVAVGNGYVLLVGEFDSTNAGLGGATGTYDATNFYGFMHRIAVSTGPSGPPNIAQGQPPVVNPLNQISIQVLSSTGGLITLQINVDALSRAPFSASTSFEDIPGRTATPAAGFTPSHQYSQAGVFAATSRVTDQASGAEAGKMRKTLAVSALEVGSAGALSAPASQTLTETKMKGKFLFEKDTPDAVTFSGKIVLPAGLDLSRSDGNTLSIGVGNITDSVLILPKGKASLPSSHNRIKSAKVKYPRLAKGTTLTVGGETATVQLSLQTADMDTGGFDTEGITKTLAASEAGMKTVERQIQVALVFAGVAYEKLAPVSYKLSSKADVGMISGRTVAP